MTALKLLSFAVPVYDRGVDATGQPGGDFLAVLVQKLDVGVLAEARPKSKEAGTLALEVEQHQEGSLCGPVYKHEAQHEVSSLL